LLTGVEWLVVGDDDVGVDVVLVLGLGRDAADVVVGATTALTVFCMVCVTLCTLDGNGFGAGAGASAGTTLGVAVDGTVAAPAGTTPATTPAATVTPDATTALAIRRRFRLISAPSV
jgi:hypothetical protein